MKVGVVMNIYLERFFTMGLDKHLNILIPNDLFLFLWGCLLMVFVLLFIGLLPIAVIKVIQDKIIKKYGENNKISLFLDIVSIVIVFVLNVIILNCYPSLRVGVSAEGIAFNPELKVLLDYAKMISPFSGLLFSLLLNNRIWRKWFKELKIEKLEKIVFVVLILLFLFVSYYFYYICQLI